MKNVKALAILISLTCLPVAAQADDHKPGTQREQFSYALGFQIGSQIGQQIMAEGLDLDPAFLARAIQDVIQGNDPMLSIDEMNAAIMAQQQQAQEQSMQQAQAAIDAGNAFREQYATQEGVTKTASGLLYKELTTGTGKKPGAQDTVVVHYRGTSLMARSLIAPLNVISPPPSALAASSLAGRKCYSLCLRVRAGRW